MGLVFPVEGWLAAVIGGLFGLVVGSFLNVVIHRLPRILQREWRAECADLLDMTDAEADDEPLTLSKPRSRCPSCQTPIKPWHNIPVLGYLMLRGRCASCGSPIGIRYPVVETVSGIGTAMVAARFGLSPEGLAAALMTWALIALSGIDLDHKLLPDRITLPLVWAGLLLSLGTFFTTPTDAILGAAAGYGVLWAIFQLFRLATGKEGMGFGDFKLLAAFGAWFGWQLLPQIVLVASVAGAMVGIVILLLARHRRAEPIPFGPFLAAAGWIAMMWGEAINHFYLRAAGLA